MQQLGKHVPIITTIDVHCYTTYLVTWELEAFPWEHIYKQQSRTLEGDDVYTVRGKL
jgi:hypothetical protein